MKVCRDCRWCEIEPHDERARFAKCIYPNRKREVDAVSGKEIPSYCEMQRMWNRLECCFVRRCGTAGRWFEPKNAEPQ